MIRSPIPKHFVSSVEAASQFKKTNDYISLLCRRGSVHGVLADTQWYVDPASLVLYFTKQEELRTQRHQQLSAKLAQEYRQRVGEVSKQPLVVLPQIKFYVHVVGFVTGAAMLLGTLVFASSMHVPEQNQYAAISQTQSPFFGTGAPSVVLPTSTGDAFAGATNFFSDVFDTFFGNETQVAQNVVTEPVQNSPIGSGEPRTNSAPASATVSVPGVAVSSPAVINTYPVIERIVERSVAVGGVSEEDLTGRLQDLYNRLAVQISNLQNPGRESPLQNFAVSQVINNLSDVRLNGTTRADGITASSVTASSLDVSGNTNFSGFLNTGTTTVNSLVVTNLSTSTFAGNLAVTGATALSSTLDVAGNTTLSNATSTNFFSSVASSTNSYTQNLQAAIVSLVNATSTNFFAGTASSTSLFSQAASLGTLSAQAFTLSGIGTFTGGFLSLASTTIGAGTQTTGLTINGGATTTGNAYFAGGLGVGIATSAVGVLQTSGNAYIGGNLFVGGNSVTLGNSSSNTLVINSSIQSHLTPDQNITYDLGSSSFYWRNVYVGNIVANNISAASTTIAGTASATFTLNSDNATSDTEDMDLIFFRGNVVPNGLLSWKSATDRFEFNQSLFIQNASTDNLTGVTLDLKGLSGQTGNLFRVASSTGTDFFNITSAGLVGIGTTTPSSLFSVQGNQYTSGSAFFGGAITATSTLGITGLATFTNGLLSLASSTIGGGTQTTGLTILGGATTTGNAYFAGSIGVGTTSPSQAFSVNGTIYSNTGYLFPDGTTQTSAAILNGAGTTGQIPYYASAGTAITATSTLFISTASNVGIGTTSPWGLLSVNANGIGSTPQFVIGSSTKTDFIVTNAGYVGIGLPTAANPLSISKTGVGTLASFYRSDANSTDNADILLGRSSASGQNINFRYVYDASSPYLNIFHGGDSAGTGLAVLKGGNVGIGTTTPWAQLSVNPNGLTGPAFVIGSSTATKFIVDNSGNVGIGTTSPFRKFSITDTVSTAQVTVAYDNSRYTDFLTNSVGDLVVTPQGQDIFSNDSNLWICSGGSCPSGTPTGTGNIVVENNIGIGTTTPQFRLTIESQNATDNLFQIATSTNQSIFVVNATGKIGVGTSTPTQQFSISDRLFVGAGGASGMGTATSTFQGDIKITGKLDVGTIDPVYTIDGVKYATYGHSTIGIKEEAVAVLEVADKNPATGKYETKIDFKDLDKSSDLWLFYQITDFGEDWKNLVINLTASFDGSVFYTKVPNEAAVIISSSEPGEVSARFIANRFDADKWPNLRPDQDDSYTGHELQTTQGGQATRRFDLAE